jgi:2-hydroxy-3-oxopropionate reductase
MKPRIAFLGIGIMGAPMAANLLKAGYAVTVWNRTVAKTKPLAEGGATVAETSAAAAKAADVVFTMMADGAAVGDLLFRDGVAEAMPRGGLVIDTSSIEPARARDHAQRLAAAGIGHLDSPVSGGPSGAEKASLAIMVGGTEADYARGSAVLACLGRPTHVGPPGAGQVAKLANQVIVALAIGAVAEGLLLAERGGADPAAVRQALLGGFADSLILQIHGQRMLDRRFLPGGPARMHLKDLNNLAAVAKESGLTLPLADEVRKLFQAVVDHGGAGYDHSAILLEIERLNPPARLGTQPDTLPD